MDKEMTEREAFEREMASTPFSEITPWMFWQAACKWQRERDAEICRLEAKNVYGDGPYMCSAAILNQGSKE